MGVFVVMCGIVGFIDKSPEQVKTEIISKMMARIHHRGPDSRGIYTDEQIALGFVRLSIIDLESGSQPIYNEDKNLVLIFNGEIYNFKELRGELESFGHVFTTDTDSETILHGYEQYGSEITKKLRGMFAFVIWDKNKDELFGARDHFGIKPFYYLNDGEKFLFSSEFKTFLEHPNFKKELNKEALKPYLTFQYSVLPETFLKGVYKLAPGHHFLYKDGDMKIERYYEVSYTSDKKPYEEYVQEINDYVEESVSVHKVSDKKVGAFLSGGVDSSYITAVAKPEKTFSVGFGDTGNDDMFNESIYAKELSDILGMENHTKLVSADEFFAHVDKVQYHSDDPHANLSAMPLYFLSQMTREHVTVILSGEGADELFGGYTSYGVTRSGEKYRRFVPRFIRKFIGRQAHNNLRMKNRDFFIKNGLAVEDYYIGQALIFDDKEARELVTDDFKDGKDSTEITAPYFERVKEHDDVTKMQYLDMHLWMPQDILLKADKMTMAHSLEVRTPFLDLVMHSLSSRIPTEYKIKNYETKYVLREAAGKVLPKEWYMRIKKGFPVPFSKWIAEDKFYTMIDAEFSADYTSEFFDVAKLKQLLKEHKQGSANHARKIWTAYAFLRWYHVYFVIEQ